MKNDYLLISLGPLYEVATGGNVEAAEMLLNYGAELHDDDVRCLYLHLVVIQANDS